MAAAMQSLHGRSNKISVKMAHLWMVHAARRFRSSDEVCESSRVVAPEQVQVNIPSWIGDKCEGVQDGIG